MCGVFGIRAPERDVSRLAYFGLFALQHRGQESAGIAVSDGGRLTVLREMGLVAHVFDEQQLQALPGEVAIGHTRYSTTGANKWSNAQPHIHHGSARTIALGHNGNLVNVEELRAELIADSIRLASGSDTELIAALVARDSAPLVEAVANTMRRLEGAYSVTALVDDVLVAFRDPFGFRPLSLGLLGDDWVVASETCALDLIGAEVVRDVQPGEVVWIDEDGLHATQAVPTGRNALCIFEHVYFARPDSRVGGVEVHGSRVRMGERLAREAPAEADLVIGVADGGTPAAIGFSKASGIPFNEALIKNRYVARTFIQPEQGMREQGIRMKFNPLDEVEGKRIVVVDDSIVRGNTTRQLVQMLFDAGAAEVHVRISSPPVVSPCFYGIDMADEDQLAAAHRSVEEMRAFIGATLAALPLGRGHAGGDRAPGGFGLPRLLHTGVPDARADEAREAPLRAGDGVRGRGRFAPRLLPRSVHDLELDAVGVVEEERVVAQHVVVLLRRRLDRNAPLPRPGVALVDDLARVGFERDVVDADAVAVVLAGDSRLAQADGGAAFAADVDDGLAPLADDVSDTRVPERLEQLAIEGKAPLERRDHEVEVMQSHDRVEPSAAATAGRTGSCWAEVGRTEPIRSAHSTGDSERRVARRADRARFRSAPAAPRPPAPSVGTTTRWRRS